MSRHRHHKGQSSPHRSPRRKRSRGKGSIFTLLLLAVVAFLNWWNNQPEQLEGKVLHVQDGDSFVMMKDGERKTVRMYAIDAPEKGQPYSKAARDFTTDLIEGKPVRLEVQNVDRYDRLISQVYLPDGRCLNHELVGAGLAWWYRRHAPHDSDLQQREEQARSTESGLWRDTRPTPPWDFRNQARADASR